MLEKQFQERLTVLSFLRLVENEPHHLFDFLDTIDYEIKPEIIALMVNRLQPFFNKKLGKNVSEDETLALMKEYLKSCVFYLFDSQDIPS